jgi:hypothetical protein
MDTQLPKQIKISDLQQIAMECNNTRAFLNRRLKQMNNTDEDFYPRTHTIIGHDTSKGKVTDSAQVAFNSRQ